MHSIFEGVNRSNMVWLNMSSACVPIVLVLTLLGLVVSKVAFVNNSVHTNSLPFSYVMLA